MSFKENLNAYIANPHKNRSKTLDVCATPNALLVVGAKQLPVVMNKGKVKTCLAEQAKKKNENPHALTIDEMLLLPDLIANPMLIFKETYLDNNGVEKEKHTIVTDMYDNRGKPIVIGLELNSKQDEYVVNRVTTMHGRDRMTGKFIAKNGKEVEGYIPRNIAEGNLIAMNIEKAPEFFRPNRLQLPEGENFVSFDNSITHSLRSVKRFDKNIFEEGEIMAIEAKTQDKQTMVINMFAAPGAGKSTSSWEMAAELKLKGLNAECVSEYAKELVYDENWELLNGSLESQKVIFDEQCRRMDRLVGKVDVIITDAPLLLNNVYLKGDGAEEIEHENNVAEKFHSYNNVNILIERTDAKYETRGRTQTLEESRELDKVILDLMTKNGVVAERYNKYNIKEAVPGIMEMLSDTNRNFEEGEIMASEIKFWSEKVGQEFTLRGGAGGNYTVLGVHDNETITLRRDDGYRLDAHRPQLNDNGTIEWASSAGGYFENPMVQQLMNKRVQIDPKTHRIYLFDREGYHHSNIEMDSITEELAAELRNEVGKYLTGKERVFQILHAYATGTEPPQQSAVSTPAVTELFKINSNGLDIAEKEARRIIDEAEQNFDSGRISDSAYDREIDKGWAIEDAVESARKNGNALPLNEARIVWRAVAGRELSDEEIQTWHDYYKTNEKVIFIDENSIFLDDLKSGHAQISDVDNYVAYWHTYGTDNNLQEFLGFSDEQYELWGKSDNSVINTFITQVLLDKAETLENLWFAEPETGTIREWHFEPDGSFGGTLIENIHSAESILEFAAEYLDPEDFYWHLNRNCEQYSHGITASDFKEILNELIVKQLKGNYSYIGADEATMKSLVEFAQERFNIQSTTPETAAIEETAQEKLTRIEQEYGKDSAEYEIIYEDLRLGWESYTSLLGGLEKELKNRGEYKESYGAEEYSAQDFLNEYLDNVDIHPTPEDVSKITNFAVGEIRKLDAVNARDETAQEITTERLTEVTIAGLLDMHSKENGYETLDTIGKIVEFLSVDKTYSEIEKMILKQLNKEDVNFLCDKHSIEPHTVVYHIWEDLNELMAREFDEKSQEAKSTQSTTPETAEEIKQKNTEVSTMSEKELLIAEILADVQKGEPEDYGHEEGLAEIEKTLQSKSLEELQAKVDEIRSFDVHEFADPGAEMVEENHRNQSPEAENNENFKGGNNMEITARVTPIENETNLKGVATVTLGGVAVHGVKIVHSEEKGLFLSMPGEPAGRNGEFKNFVVPANEEAHAKLKNVVLEAYNHALEHGKQEIQENPSMKADIKVSGFRENTYENNIMGDCNVTINDTFVIKGVKVIATKASGEISIAMPSKQDQYGADNSIVVPTSKDFFAQIKDAVIKGYELHKESIIGNTPYNKLGEELSYKSFNAEFAKNFLAEQLNADGVNWSGKIENGKANIAVNKTDEPKLEAAVEKAKTAGATAKEAAKEATKQEVDIPVQTANRKK